MCVVTWTRIRSRIGNRSLPIRGTGSITMSIKIKIASSDLIILIGTSIIIAISRVCIADNRILLITNVIRRVRVAVLSYTLNFDI